MLRLYRGELAVGAVCLAALLFFAAWALYVWRQSRLGQYKW